MNSFKLFLVLFLLTNSLVFSQTITKHKVVKGETLYGISKKYGISIKELQLLNPTLKTKLPIGYHLILTKKELTVTQAEIILPYNVSKDNISNQVFINPESNQLVLSKTDSLIEVASKNIGIQYKSGGIGKKGFDCSGLMFESFKKVNITLPRSSSQMAKIGTKIEPSSAKKGDLIFFKTNGNKKTINHVGLITEVNGDEIKFIHSSIKLGVIISSTKESYYSKRFIQIKRIF